MLKPAVALASLAFLAACATGGGSGIEKASVADDAVGMMLTVTPVDQVAQCIARVGGTQPQPIAGGYAIADANGAPAYRVGAFDDPLRRYTTKVDIMQRDPRGSETAACIIPSLA